MPGITTAKLRDICQVHDIAGYSGKRKKELIAMVSAKYGELFDAGLTALKAAVTAAI